MANMPVQSIVEGHPQRSKILEQLIAGIPVRDISAWTNPRISHSAIQRYSLGVVKPALRASKPVMANSRVLDDKPLMATVRTEVQASPVIQRLESIWSKTTGLVDQIDVDNGAPILNAATKQVELLARLTGELKDNAGASLTLNIVCPAGEDKQRVDFSDPDAIEMGFE